MHGNKQFLQAPLLCYPEVEADMVGLPYGFGVAQVFPESQLVSGG